MNINILDKFPQHKIPGNTPIVVAYGGGTNSTALLIAMWLKGIKPAHILFCDTGGEREETYQFISRFDDWLDSVGFPRITRLQHRMTGTRPRPRTKVAFRFGKFLTPAVLAGDIPWVRWAIEYHWFRQSRQYETLLEECLILGTPPSKAFGSGKCSHKWKVEPQQKFIKQTYGSAKVQVWVGIHAGEQNRLLARDGLVKPFETSLGWDCYPLAYWGLSQKHCAALNARFAPTKVAKSSCWFCPNAKVQEIQELKHDHPELFDLGVSVENLAKYHGSGKGLARSFDWSDIEHMSETKQLALDLFAEKRTCTCID